MKQSNDRNFNERSWRSTALATAVLIGLSATSASVNSATNGKKIGDLEIYAPAIPGTATIFMMLDISGSMGSSSVAADYGRCSGGYKILTTEKITVVVSKEDGTNETVQFEPKGCVNSSVAKLDRLSRLQKALIELLADEVYLGNTVDDSKRVTDKGSLPDDYEIGVGAYSNNGDGRTGKVIVPTGPLTASQRLDLIKKIKELVAQGNTPTGTAYAESGAYMMGTTTINGKDSGFNNSVSTSKKTDLKSYKSPISQKQCSGNGIYLLTDGEPNGPSNTDIKNIMSTSLTSSNSSLSVGSCNSLTGGGTGWGCMAEYAALLRNPLNPIKSPIKTATVGFGKAFAGLTDTRSITIDGKSRDIIDCTSGISSGNGKVSDNTRNLCKLGERDGNYGSGGFYYTDESEGIANSIVDFAASLVQIINTAPSGTITIPNDPYRASNQLAYAYLPMLDPDIASTASIWEGNLKKYNLNQGTLFGKNDSKLYRNLAGDLSATTSDLWQQTSVNNSSNIDVGGVYAQLTAPNSGLISVRTVYVEDYDINVSNGNKKPVLRKLSVDANGNPQGFELLVDSVTESSPYNQLNKRRLLSFLGFKDTINAQGAPESLLDSDGSLPDNAADVNQSMKLAKPDEEIRVLGGVVHSKPTAVSYSADLDDDGRIGDTRDDYVLFGSMDGAIHLVDADDGKEEVAIIPRQMIINQSKALVKGSLKGVQGEPYFGVDAPWLVTTDYKYDLDNKKVKVDTANNKGMFAYGGLRMGGEAFYGIDITNKSEPKVLFTFTPEGRNNTTSNDNFARLGQIWSKPTAAKIRITKDADPTNVIIFGGGYDIKYETDSYAATSIEPAKGNAIYMIDAKSGELLWSASNTGTNNSKYKKVDGMLNSIVGGITILDRDNDGLMDHLYAADLGGQVFRADFENARPAKSGFSAVDSFSNKRVVRVLDASSGIESKYSYRFYERPVVSFYRSEGGTNNGNLFALVNVISGDRSAPLSTLRDDNTYANRVYGIIDTDITNTSLYDSNPTLTIENLKESNLVNLANTLGTNPDENKKKEVRALMLGTSAIGTTGATAAKNGWYYPLTRFEGYNNVRYNKGVGDSVVINNLLYTTVYNPDKQYTAANSCSARIAGGSERQLYCLPYGICMEDTSKSGTGGFIPAGQGIQELTLGAFNKDNTNLKVLIGTTTITDRILAANRVEYGAGGKFTDSNGNKVDSNIKDLSGVTSVGSDGSAPEYIFNERYTFQPRAWYERQQ